VSRCLSCQTLGCTQNYRFRPMPATVRILVASSLAPLAAVIPLFVLGSLMWSCAIAGPFAHSELSDISALQAALEFVLPFHALLAFWLLAISLILRAAESLTRRNMLRISAVISIAVGVVFGGGWWDPEDLRTDLQNIVINVAVQSAVVFFILGSISLVWFRIAMGPRPQASGTGGA